MSLFKISPKTLILGGIAIAAAGAALKNRDKVAGLLGVRSSAPEPPHPEPAQPRPAGPSNYDVGGPVANTATTVPAPDAVVLEEDGGIDERAEEAAAAAEAAAIGGPAPEYAGLERDEQATDSMRAVMESGEGESEGLEQAEADLVDEVEPMAGTPSDAARRLDETIEQADNPTVGESMEGLQAHEADVRGEEPAEEQADEPPREGALPAEPAAAAQPPDEQAGPAEPAAAAQPPDEQAGPAETTPERATGAAPGLPDTGGAAAVERAAGAEEEEEGEGGPFIHPDQTSLLGGEHPAEDEPPREGPRETSAAEKSAAVWEPPAPPAARERSEDEEGGDDDGGSEWQTWSGRAIRP